MSKRSSLYYSEHTVGRSTPVAQLAPRNLLTRWDVSSIPANGIFLTKNKINKIKMPNGWRTINSLLHKIRLHGRRGKGMAESFSRQKSRHAPQKEGGLKILCDLPPVWPRLVRPLMSRMDGKKTHTHIRWHNSSAIDLSIVNLPIPLVVAKRYKGQRNNHGDNPLLRPTTFKFLLLPSCLLGCAERLSLYYSEHPSVRGGKCQTFRRDQRLQTQNLFHVIWTGENIAAAFVETRLDLLLSTLNV